VAPPLIIAHDYHRYLQGHVFGRALPSAAAVANAKGGGGAGAGGPSVRGLAMRPGTIMNESNDVGIQRSGSVGTVGEYLALTASAATTATLKTARA
jgi:hypothetical protein